jgi:hypothetical protein
VHVLQSIGSCDRRLSSTDSEVVGERGTNITNQHQNQNQNLQMIAIEECDDQPRVAVVTCGGMRTRPDVTEKGKGVEQWIRKEVEPMPTFNPQKEKETYQQARKEILGPDWITSTSKTPPSI